MKPLHPFLLSQLSGVRPGRELTFLSSALPALPVRSTLAALVPNELKKSPDYLFLVSPSSIRSADPHFLCSFPLFAPPPHQCLSLDFWASLWDTISVTYLSVNLFLVGFNRNKTCLWNDYSALVDRTHSETHRRTQRQQTVSHTQSDSQLPCWPHKQNELAERRLGVGKTRERALAPSIRDPSSP